jgi:NADPH2:quinone reductase
MVSHLLERRMLVHNVTDRLPLDQIAAAHELVESGTALGNVVLVVDESQS